MQKEDILKQLEPLTRVSVRQVEHTPRTRIVVTPDQVILRPGSGGHLVPMNEKGVRSLANFTGMPQTMAKQISPELFGRVTTELLARKGRYAILMEAGAIIDFAAPGQQRNIPTERVIDTIERVIPHAEYTRVTTQEYAATLEVVGEKREPVVRGDLVRAGALVAFSPVGTVQPLVQSFVVRLACTNGQVANQVLREFRGGGEGDDIWQWFRRSIQDAYGSLNAIVNRYREMIKDRIPPAQRALMLEEMLHRARIGGEVADAIRTRAIEQPLRNSYELLNLITWASTYLLREPAEINRAREVVADFTDKVEHQTFCPLCHSRR